MGTRTVSKSKRSKVAKSALAIALALALSLGGTLAWTAFSQEVTNELKEDINPGGRLHDDFIWTDANKNKDIYVENFTEKDGGKEIYARVMLKEYLEIGEGAGEYKDADTIAASTDLVAYPAGASANEVDKDKWQTHLFNKDDQGSGGEADASDFHNYFNLKFGGSTIYMPTFNKDRYSLEADINGSLNDMDKNGNLVPYANYRDYTSLVQHNEGADYTERHVANYGNGTQKLEVHKAQLTTYSAKVKSVDEWTGAETEPCWVYDTDGWAYWSQPIKPGETTGLLLDNILRTEAAFDGDWYYAVHAIGEFVTADEIVEGADADAGKVFFDKAKSPDRQIASGAKIRDILFGAADREEAQKAAFETELSTARTAAVGSTFTLLGTEYIKLAQDDDNALVLSNKVASSPTYQNGTPFGSFGSTNCWRDSYTRYWCNDIYYNNLPISIKDRIVQTGIKTIDPDAPASFITTQDKVFCLSEADVYGTNDGVPVTDSSFYTYGATPLVPSNMISTMYENKWRPAYYLRSPCTLVDGKLTRIVAVTKDGVMDHALTSYDSAYRPAFWINLKS